MATHIVPVWRRQLEASRTEAETGVTQLLQHFTALSGALSDLVTAASEGPGRPVVSAQALLERHPDALELVQRPAERLRTERAALLDVLQSLEASQQELQREGLQIQRLGRHAGLLAMNASIEAHRSGAGDGGFTAVANEVRALARAAEAHGQRVQTLVQAHADRLVSMRREAELADAGDDAEALEQRLRALAWIDRLIGDLGASLNASQPLHAATQAARDGIDALFADFQFQDRLHQMTGALQQDMARFEAWLAGPDAGSAREATQWLERLQQTYTMQEQLAHHHGNAEIRRSSGVEFF